MNRQHNIAQLTELIIITIDSLEMQAIISQLNEWCFGNSEKIKDKQQTNIHLVYNWKWNGFYTGIFRFISIFSVKTSIEYIFATL